MQFSFDLISDLHVESWNNFDWTDKPTSPYCVVAGDVARDRTLLVETLQHLGTVYAGVFYIDGNEEHKNYYNDLGDSYRDLKQAIADIPNVIYIHDNVIIINGVAILATNGWWSWDFDNTIDFDQSIEWFKNKTLVTDGAVAEIAECAYNDTLYLANSVRKLQTHPEVHRIVIISHTVPLPELVMPDPDLAGSWRFNVMGNKHLMRIVDEDTENKINTWCFGHYHRPVDQIYNGIRFVNNCRGRGDSEWRQTVYQPKRISF